MKYVLRETETHTEGKPCGLEIIFKRTSMVGSLPDDIVRLHLDFPLDDQMEKYVLDIIENYGT